MSRELVERLRKGTGDRLAAWDMMNEAADEVERLTGLYKAAEAQEWRELQEARAEIERLTNAIRRIDGINDNPTDYNPAINAICDAILRDPKP